MRPIVTRCTRLSLLVLLASTLAAASRLRATA
jgi:hypothetical protein